jgi:ribonuclease P protein component
VTYLYLTGAATPARAGLIISKNAGGSVVRHSIARQLRHALRQYLINLPDGSLLVIRALPSAIKSDLRQELSEAIPFLLEKTKVAK